MIAHLALSMILWTSASSPSTIEHKLRLSLCVQLLRIMPYDALVTPKQWSRAERMANVFPIDRKVSRSQIADFSRNWLNQVLGPALTVSQRLRPRLLSLPLAERQLLVARKHLEDEVAAIILKMQEGRELRPMRLRDLLNYFWSSRIFQVTNTLMINTQALQILGLPLYMPSWPRQIQMTTQHWLRHESYISIRRIGYFLILLSQMLMQLGQSELTAAVAEGESIDQENALTLLSLEKQKANREIEKQGSVADREFKRWLESYELVNGPLATNSPLYQWMWKQYHMTLIQ